MSKMVLAGLLSLAPAVMFAQLAQLESNTLTITATQQVNTQPDQAVFDVYVSANLTQGLNDILAALPGTGISAANIAGISTLYNGTVQWWFEVPVPLANVQTFVGALATGQQTFVASNNGMTLAVYPGGLQVSPALLASQTCPIASLVSSARAQARTIANAAGFSVGPILSLDTSSSTTNSLSFLLGNPWVVNGEASPNCSVAVTFQMN